MFELKKSEIVRGKKDFQKVYSQGKSYADKNIVLYVLHDEKYNGKVGFAAGKKLGCAVVRNRVKRLLREAYRLCKNKISGDCAIILVGRKNLTESKSDDAIKSLANLLRRAGISDGEKNHDQNFYRAD